MADKEERILITKCTSHRHALRVSSTPIADDDGMYCDKSGKWVRITEKDCAKCKAPVLLGLSRSEVIEKIAKGIYSWETDEHMPVPWERLPEDIKSFRKSHAEAALNALLEDKK